MPRPLGLVVGASRTPVALTEIADVASRLERHWARDGGSDPVRAELYAALRRSLAPERGLGLFPDVALRLDRLLRAGDPSLDEVVTLLLRDVELSRAVIVAASRAVHGRSIDDLGRAVTRLGLEGVWRVAMSSILRAPVFRVHGWEADAHAARTIAVVAAQLGAEICPDPREQGIAFLGGLLAELGTLFILRAASAASRRPDGALVAEVISEDGASLGLTIVASMPDLSPAVARAVATIAGAPVVPTLAGRSAHAAVLASRAVVLGEPLSDDDVALVEIAEDADALVARAASIAASLRD